jgi:hypothetical protein
VNYIVNTLGQRTKRTTSDAATSVVTDWTYDALGQVETEDQPGTTTDRAFQYDHIGNRKKSANSLTLPATDNYTSNALNQYTSITSGQLTSVPQYDFDGNMTHGPHPADPTIPAIFFYDAENLSGVSPRMVTFYIDEKGKSSLWGQSSHGNILY